jgi:hypothetical protein
MSKTAAASGIVIVFGVGAVLGLVEVLVEPHGWLWTTLRGLVFVAFVTLIVLWLVARVRDRASRPYEGRNAPRR